ncbi:hypothetical protein D3C76_982540 [compost metagenome]
MLVHLSCIKLARLALIKLSINFLCSLKYEKNLIRISLLSFFSHITNSLYDASKNSSK